MDYGNWTNISFSAWGSLYPSCGNTDCVINACGEEMKGQKEKTPEGRSWICSNVLSTKGWRRNRFAFWRSDFGRICVDLREQNRRNSTALLRILWVKIGQRWPEDEMRKCEVISASTLRIPPTLERGDGIWIRDCFNILGSFCSFCNSDHCAINSWKKARDEGKRWIQKSVVKSFAVEWKNFLLLSLIMNRQ